MFRIAPNPVSYCSLLLLSVLLTSSAFSQSIQPEWVIADELQQPGIEGDIVHLTVENQDILGIFQNTLHRRSYGAILLLHDAGGNPDSNNIIAPLRRNLPTRGWSSLAIQLPLLDEPDSSNSLNEYLTESVKRINKAMTFLNENNHLNIVILGHGSGAIAAFKYAQGIKEEETRGVISINLSTTPGPANKEILSIIGDIKIPVLDIYNRAFPQFRPKGINKRRAAVRFNRKWQFVAIDGGSHNFNGDELWLLERVFAWAMKTAPAMEINTQSQ